MRSGNVGVSFTTGQSLAVFALTSATIGLVGTAPDRSLDIPVNFPLHLTDELRNELGASGTLPPSIDDVLSQRVEAQGAIVLVIADEGLDEMATLANVAGDPAQKTGAWMLLYAEGFAGLAPKIIAAPGHTHQRNGEKNPAGAALEQVALQLRARAILDGPETFGQDSALIHRNDYDAERCDMWTPFVTTTRGAGNVIRPASGFIAGALSALAATEGVVSPLNKPLRSITGLAAPITYGTEDSLATILGNNGINAIVHTHSGIRMFGDETLAKSPTSESGYSIAASWAIDRTQDVLHDLMMGFIGEPAGSDFFNAAGQLASQVLDAQVTLGTISDYRFQVLSKVPPSFRWSVVPLAIARSIQVYMEGGADFGGLDLATIQETIRNLFMGSTTQAFNLVEGNQQIQIQTLRGFAPGQDVKIFSAADSDLAAWGTVVSYDQGTGQLVIAIENVRGEGAFNDGQVVLSPPGPKLEIAGNASTENALALQLSETELTGFFLRNNGQDLIIKALRVIQKLAAAPAVLADLANDEFTIAKGPEANTLVLQARIENKLISKTI